MGSAVLRRPAVTSNTPAMCVLDHERSSAASQNPPRNPSQSDKEQNCPYSWHTTWWDKNKMVLFYTAKFWGNLLSKKNEPAKLASCLILTIELRLKKWITICNGEQIPKWDPKLPYSLCSTLSLSSSQVLSFGSATSSSMSSLPSCSNGKS